MPWTGLEATMRADARIIDDVNKLALTYLQRPEEPLPGPQRYRSRMKRWSGKRSARFAIRW